MPFSIRMLMTADVLLAELTDAKIIFGSVGLTVGLVGSTLTRLGIWTTSSSPIFAAVSTGMAYMT